MLPLLIRQLPSTYRTRKKILTYKKYARNLGQNNFDLFVDHTNAEIGIVPTITTNLLGR